MKALVTGANGFLGSHIVDRLLLRGHEVRCLVRPKASTRWLTSPCLEVWRGSLLDKDFLKKALKNIDVVLHVAGTLVARDWATFHAANIQPARALLEAAEKSGRNLRRFVLISSTGAVGPSPNGRLLNENDPPHPISYYGRSKLEAEEVVHRFEKVVPATILRPCAVYGPRDANFIIMFKHARSGLVPLVGSKEQYISLIHADDLSGVAVAAAELEAAAGQTYILAGDRPYSRTEILDTVQQVVGRRTIRVVIPPVLLGMARRYRAITDTMLKRPHLLGDERLESLEERFWTYDAGKAMKELGLRQKYTLEEGLRQTYAWYLEAGWLGKQR